MAATLKMVAERAGVSIRTAGRALSGSGPVRSEVAHKVLEAARELQYVPNAAARSLKQRSSRIVGILTGDTFSTEAGQRKVRMLGESLRRSGRHTLLGALPGTLEETRSLLRSWVGIAEAVIFLHWRNWNPETLRAIPIRFLFLDCKLEDERFDRVEEDRESGVAAAVSSLIGSGRKRIVRAGGSTATGRRAGFERAIVPGVESFQIDCGGLEFIHGFEAGGRIMELKADAVFFDTDRMALGFYRYAQQHGIRIPEDVSVAGFDNDGAGAFALPALTTVSHPDGEMVEFTVARLTGPPENPVKKVFPNRLISRESISFFKGENNK